MLMQIPMPYLVQIYQHSNIPSKLPVMVSWMILFISIFSVKIASKNQFPCKYFHIFSQPFNLITNSASCPSNRKLWSHGYSFLFYFIIQCRFSEPYSTKFIASCCHNLSSSIKFSVSFLRSTTIPLVLCFLKTYHIDVHCSTQNNVCSSVHC